MGKCDWVFHSPASGFHQSGILQFPQGVDRLLPPAVEQLHYFVDGIVEVNPPIFICPAVFPGQVCPAQDKGIQYLCFVGQGCECGGFKKEIRKPGKADRLFRLMDINVFVISCFVDG